MEGGGRRCGRKEERRLGDDNMVTTARSLVEGEVSVGGSMGRKPGKRESGKKHTEGNFIIKI